uniref:CSON012845 protein n=1 Tax=Culicoides sonorensis TaxID=179676 RepID=A0A336K4Q1_CULSO
MGWITLVTFGDHPIHNDWMHYPTKLVHVLPFVAKTIRKWLCRRLDELRIADVYELDYSANVISAENSTNSSEVSVKVLFDNCCMYHSNFTTDHFIHSLIKIQNKVNFIHEAKNVTNQTYEQVKKRRGIPHIEPSFWFGCSIQNEIMLRKITFIESFNKIYWSQPEQSVTGFMQIVTPVLIVRDVELIKEITVKKFDCFQNHVFSDIPDVDTIFGKSLFSLTDQKWRVTRNMLSPTFTGMKMRTMFKLMHDCAKSTVDALNEKSNGKEVVLEVKDLFNRYCNDTIATTIFGIEVNSMKDKDNEFFLMGKKLTQFGQVATLKFFLVFISPKIFKLLGMNLLDRKASNYFLKLVKDTIQYRIDKKIVRPDMINMYIESLKEDPNHNDKKVIDNEYVIKSDDTEAILKKWDLEEFVCQCALFFFAGFETAAGYFMFLAYELAKNPEIQNTLYEEINEANRNLGDKPLTYEYIQSLKYFDCVIQGIPHIEPSIWFGCTIQNELILRKLTFMDSFKKLYWSQPEQSVTGFMQIVTPVLIVRDVELIKEITVKKFECFQNHTLSDTPDIDKIFGKALFLLGDQKWRVTRNMLSPIFTGMKMRTMFKLMHDCAKRTVDALNEKSNGKEVVLEVKDLFNRFESASGYFMFLAYELAKNPEIQNTLYEEINEANRNLGDKPLTYEYIQNLKYFDCVILGIPHIEPSIWFGCTIQNELMLRKLTFMDSFNKLYWSQPEHSVTGFMQIITPILVVRDVELIKEITVKKFDCFQNHTLSETPDIDKIFGKALFTMTDLKWRVTRNMLSPAFTGSKMRTMFKLMHDCAKSTVDALNDRSDGKEIVLEVKDLFNRYCNDTIATTTFGIEVNSMREENNEFYLMGKKLTTFGQIESMKFFLVFICPKIFKMLGMNLLDAKAADYFFDLVKNTIQYRIENKIVRPDMINMYIESLKDDQNDKKIVDNEYVIKTDDTEAVLKKWDLDEFIVQCVSFFFAGFETAASWFMFLAYELAMNPEIQNTLIEEIDEANRNLGDKPLTYEYLQNLKYFDCVIQETLRLWPVNIANDRKCTKDCTLYDSNGKAHEFKKGDFISLLVMAIQRDPKYFENPDKFIPERWFPENRDKINPYTFLTFGIGPRMCIGNRFVMMEGKCLFYTLLSRFRIEKCEKTPDPIVFPKGSFALNPVGGMWLKFVIRNDV